jgi:hypothetical protein
MKIDVYRFAETDRSILGRVAVDGQQFCFDLEPGAFTPCMPDIRAFPAGSTR